MKKLMISIIVMLALIAPLALVSCGPESGAEPAARDGVELDFWSWRVEDVAEYNELIRRFEAENPGIRVNFTPYQATEYNTVLSAAVQGGNAPDIIHLRAYGGLEQYAAPGFLMRLDDKLPLRNRFEEDTLRAVTSISDGNIYGVPFASQTLVIYYNSRMYDELGLEIPETWDEFLSNLQAMQDAGITPLANGSAEGWTLEVMHGVISPNFYGANEFFDAIMSGEAKFTDEAYRRSLAKLLELRPYMPDGFTGVNYVGMQMGFINEMAGHFIGGSWEAAYFNSQNPDLEFGVFAGPVENQGDTRYVSSYADGSFGASATTQHPEEALKFLEFLSSQETGQFFADELKLQSDIPGVTSNDPYLQRILELNENSTPYIQLVGFRYEQPTGSSLLQSGLEGMMAGTIDPAEVTRQVQQGIETWFTPGQ